jgi:hypothetical protein
MQHDHHTDHELKVIGSICTSWASLEYLVDETALHLRRKEKKLGATEDEKLRMTFQRRLKIMKELALKYIESCYHNELEELCKKIGGQLAPQRNSAIHECWYPDSSESPRLLVGEGCTATIDALGRLADEISQTADRLERFLFAMDLHHTSSKSSGPDYAMECFDEDWVHRPEWCAI